MRHLRMIEKQKAWKREDDFDKIEIIVKIHAQIVRRLYAGFDLEPFYTGLYNPRWQHNPEEYTLELNVEAEILKLEILFSEPPPLPQDDLSPRQSHAAGTGLDEPSVPHVVTEETKQEGTFPFQADIDDSLHINGTSPEQEGTISLLADVGVKSKATATTVQVTVCEGFARPTKNRQQRRVAA